MEQDQSLFSLTIDPSSKSHLMDAAKWARFIAIAGMILLALGLLLSFLTATAWADSENMRLIINGREDGELTAMSRVVYLVITIFFLLVLFFPFLFLLQFANKVRTALEANQQGDLNIAFQNLKRYLRYVGILILIILGIYLLAFVLGLISAGTA